MDQPGDVTAPTIVIVGAGPGIGLATARRFAREGFRIGLIARNEAHLGELALVLRGDGHTVEYEAADASAPDQIDPALERLRSRLGRLDAVCVSPLPDVGLIKPVLETTPADLANALALSTIGVAAVVASVVPEMIARGSGTILFTTGSGAMRPSSQRAASAVATTAESTYIGLLHDALTPHGVHVAQVTIVGAVGAEEKHDPHVVAERLWREHHQPGERHSVLD